MAKNQPSRNDHAFSDLKVDSIRVLDGFNPRGDLGDMTEIVDSVRVNGVITPLLVCPDQDNNGVYYLVAGARRLEAAKRCGLPTVPCFIRTTLDINSPQALAIATSENKDGTRQALAPLDLAKAYQRLAKMAAGERELSERATHEAVAKLVGCSREHVRNTLKLLDAPESVREKLAAGEVSKQAVRTLMEVPEDVRQRVSDRLVDLPTEARNETAVRRLANEELKAEAVARREGDKPAKQRVVLWRDKKEVRAEIDIVVGNILDCEKDKDDDGRDCYCHALAALLWVTGELNNNSVGTGEFTKVYKALVKERKDRQKKEAEERAEGDA